MNFLYQEWKGSYLNWEDVLLRLQENDPHHSSQFIMVELEEYEPEVERGYHFHNNSFQLNIYRSDGNESGLEHIPSLNEDDSSFNKIKNALQQRWCL